MALRTRIAPSPTGPPHIGTAYVALFNICFAQSQGGICLFRLEDTDRRRFIENAEADIMAALRWLGLDWKEGPDCGGDFGPYRQSERTAIYREHAKQLLAEGRAFRCFCTQEVLQNRRQVQKAQQGAFGYDGHCLKIDVAKAKTRAQAGEPYVVRMKRPDHGVCRFEDQLRGVIEIDWRQVDMQVLLKADGLPTYHLANVVDDHLMQVSHVIRGEEWINSTPKHLLLYQYFGWDVPVFYHLPLLRNADKSKVSKRKNPTSLNDYRDQGLLPEAMLNYLALMGWSMADGREVFSLQEMVDAFDVRRLSLGGAAFDPEKLSWLSGQWIRSMPPEVLTSRYLEWLPESERAKLPEPQKFEAIMALVQPRAERFDQIMAQIDYLIGDIDPPEATLLVRANADQTEKIKNHLYLALYQLKKVSGWNKDNIQQALAEVATRLEMKMKFFLRPIFVAISGRQVMLPLFHSMVLLGRVQAQARIEAALAVLGGCSEAERQALEQRWGEKSKHPIR